MGKRSKRKQETPQTTSASSAATRTDRLGRDWPWALLLLFVVCLAYQPVWYAGFIWDDDAHITKNPVIIGPLGLKEIWTTSAAWYYPLSLTTIWFEHALWGLNPLPYHLVNVLVHGACAIVLWQVLRRLAIPGAWLGAALWALHPVAVETVAWVTEIKNTQSTLFYLLSIFFFIRGIQKRTGAPFFDRNDALTLLFAILAMTSKSSTVVLPLVLCLSAGWIERTWNWRSLARTAPIFLCAILASAVTVLTIHLNAVNDHSQESRSVLDRIVLSGDVFWFYLGKIVWPYPLMFIYPHWQIHSASILSYLPVLAAVVLMATLWFKRDLWSRAPFFAIAYFVIALLPVLGFLDQYFWRYSFVGDHFQYLASMSPLALAGAGLSMLLDSLLAHRAQLRVALCALPLLLLGFLSWRQSCIYESEETLWTDTIAKNPGCGLAFNNLGNVLLRQGHVDESITLLRKSIAIRDTSPDVHNSLGNALLEIGQPNHAIDEYQKALALDPVNVGAYNNLGLTYAQTGHTNQAILQYEKALEINPAYAEARNNLGNILLQSGQLDDAMEQFQKALEINPNYADAHNNIGWVLLKKGDTAAAMAQFQQAIAIDPTDSKARNNLGIALAQTGHLDEAIVQFQEVLRLSPHDVNAQNNLNRALSLRH